MEGEGEQASERACMCVCARAFTLPEKHLSKAGQPQPESNLEPAEYRGVEHPAHTK